MLSFWPRYFTPMRLIFADMLNNQALFQEIPRETLKPVININRLRSFNGSIFLADVVIYDEVRTTAFLKNRYYYCCKFRSI